MNSSKVYVQLGDNITTNVKVITETKECVEQRYIVNKFLRCNNCGEFLNSKKELRKHHKHDNHQ